jgi:hypothetical protein
MELRSVRNQPKDSVNDHWIINQLFGIINLEQRVSRAISESDGPLDESVRRQVEELKAWVAQFDQALDQGNFAPLPPAGSCRLPACA